MSKAMTDKSSTSPATLEVFDYDQGDKELNESYIRRLTLHAKQCEAELRAARELYARSEIAPSAMRSALERIAKGYEGPVGNCQGLSGTDCAEIAKGALASTETAPIKKTSPTTAGRHVDLMKALADKLNALDPTPEHAKGHVGGSSSRTQESDPASHTPHTPTPLKTDSEREIEVIDPYVMDLVREHGSAMNNSEIVQKFLPKRQLASPSARGTNGEAYPLERIDAARYRWLRSEAVCTEPRYYIFWNEFEAKLCREEKMDALIDAEMASKESDVTFP